MLLKSDYDKDGVIDFKDFATMINNPWMSKFSELITNIFLTKNQIINFFEFSSSFFQIL